MSKIDGQFVIINIFYLILIKLYKIKCSLIGFYEYSVTTFFNATLCNDLTLANTRQFVRMFIFTSRHYTFVGTQRSDMSRML